MSIIANYIWETDSNTGYVLNAVRLIDLFNFCEWPYSFGAMQKWQL